MLASIYNQISKILTDKGFRSSYVYENNNYENRLDARFATIDVLSDRSVGKAISNDGNVFEEYELEVKISMYFKPSETINAVEECSDTLLQSFYQIKNLNITSIFTNSVRYSSVYKCLKSEMIFKLSYLLKGVS